MAAYFPAFDFLGAIFLTDKQFDPRPAREFIEEFFADDLGGEFLFAFLVEPAFDAAAVL